MSLSYESSGVRYDQLDAFKRACQQAARTTAGLLRAHGYAEPAATRGESAYLIEAEDHFLAHVEEGLGTKNLVADAVAAATGRCFYREIAIDTVATIVNDLVTCGALPIVGRDARGRRGFRLVRGRAAGGGPGAGVRGRAAGRPAPCGAAARRRRCAGVVNPATIVLAGSAVGRIAPKSRRITGDVQDGDAIVFLASSGVQTNGLSLCRKIAEQLPLGYETRIGFGDPRTLGEALLAPSVIYVGFVRECQRQELKLNYVAHVTGHGWRKLMRLEEPFVYEITNVRPPPAVFRFLQQAGPVAEREMYATFNQGVGFAALVPPDTVSAVVEAALASGYDAWEAGRVRKEGTRKAVVVPPLGLTFEADTLQLR